MPLSHGSVRSECPLSVQLADEERALKQPEKLQDDDDDHDDPDDVENASVHIDAQQ